MNLAGVLLARHGQTNDNREPMRFQGFSDTPLNETGRAQAVELAERVADGEPIISLWSSDLSRARETAETVGARIGLALTLDARLREANRGEWEGHLFLDIEREQPERYAAWRRAGPEFRFPGGESLLEQQQRVRWSMSRWRCARAGCSCRVNWSARGRSRHLAETVETRALRGSQAARQDRPRGGALAKRITGRGATAGGVDRARTHPPVAVAAALAKGADR